MMPVAWPLRNGSYSRDSLSAWPDEDGLGARDLTLKSMLAEELNE